MYGFMFYIMFDHWSRASACNIPHTKIIFDSSGMGKYSMFLRCGQAGLVLVIVCESFSGSQSEEGKRTKFFWERLWDQLDFSIVKNGFYLHTLLLMFSLGWIVFFSAVRWFCSCCWWLGNSTLISTLQSKPDSFLLRGRFLICFSVIFFFISGIDSFCYANYSSFFLVLHSAAIWLELNRSFRNSYVKLNQCIW